MQTPIQDKKVTELKRGLNNRHIQLIAIGGAIGTGLFMGSGRAINISGSSILFVYAFTGLMLFFVMRAMGEILLSNPDYKSFLDFTNDILGDWAGFMLGWTYWLCWIVTGVADIIAICHYSSFWFEPSYALWIALFTILALLSLNLIAIKIFGEVEFWFAITKLIAITSFILIGAYLIISHSHIMNGSNISITNLWKNNAIAPNGWLGVFDGFQMAIFSFVGIELAGTSAAEVANPEKTLPRAINAIPLRILLCYILSLFVVICITPYDKISTTSSPFVDLFFLIGIPTGATIINIVLLLAAFSSVNSGVFSTSRMLFGLAQIRNAPGFLGELAKHSVPVNALFVSCICLILTYLTIHYIPSIMNAFTIITSISAVLFLFVWSVILVSYLVYYHKKHQEHISSNYKLMGGHYTCWLVLAFFLFIIIILTTNKETAIALMVTPLWFLLLNIMFFIRKKIIQH